MCFCVKKIKLRKFLKYAKKCDPRESKYFETIAEYYARKAKKSIERELGLKLIVISDTHGDLAFGNYGAFRVVPVAEQSAVVDPRSHCDA